jgi:RNA polymerase sigma-70 factor (TIGR02960 family)
MSDVVLTRARGGDEQAFAQLTEPLRRELQAYCYRMLGSLQDAEDAVQETLVSAWRGLDGFAGRASLRAWLYGIATHRCLNEIRAGSRRPQRVGAAGASLPFVAPAPTRMGETPWLEPYPDELLEGLPDAAPGPEARYEQREAIGLAFITALQRLPERQRAVLVLRDVLGYRATEVAEMLDTSEATVTSALQRARAALRERRGIPRERAPAPGSPAERALVGEFADAFVAGDIERVVAMLTEDAWVTMPPEPFEYQGREAIADFLHHAGLPGRDGREARFIPVRANGQPAFAHYVRGPGQTAGHLSGIFVLTLAGAQIAALTRFAASNVSPQFALPADVDWPG